MKQIIVFSDSRRRQVPPRVPQRKRHGAVQNVTQNDALEVSLRIRPLAGDEENCLRVLSDRQVSIVTPECSVAFARTQLAKEYQFTFRHVFEPAAAQRSVFEQTGISFVEDLVRGRNGVLFTYGATTSGKTYTMIGSPGDPGLLPRCFDVLFNTIARFQVSCNFLPFPRLSRRFLLLVIAISVEARHCIVHCRMLCISSFQNSGSLLKWHIGFFSVNFTQ